MKDVATLVRECRSMGVTLTLVAGRVKLRAKKPLPENLMAALRDQKEGVIALLAKEQHTGLECWILEEWRRVSIPDWRRILKESIEKKNGIREEYARWMLREVLQDPEYQEPER